MRGCRPGEIAPTMSVLAGSATPTRPTGILNVMSMRLLGPGMTSSHPRVKAGNKHPWQTTTNSDNVAKVETPETPALTTRGIR
jgi:hypothetical protein